MTDKKSEEKKEPFESTELDGAYKEDPNAKFKENVIQDIPEIRPQEFSKPISDLYRNKIGKPTRKNRGLENRRKNEAIASRKALKKRRAKNKRAKKARKKNRKKR